MDELSEEDKLTVSRAKNPAILSQPFHVAEVFTGTPGVLVTLEDTINGFKGSLKVNSIIFPKLLFIWWEQLTRQPKRLKD